MLTATAAGALPARAVDRRAAAAPAGVRWIDGAAPAGHEGQTFGMAWPRGSFPRGRSLRVTDAAGRGVPSQTWAAAYWPDGSVKWTAHAVPAGAGLSDTLIVGPGREAPPGAPVSVREGPDTVTFRSGELT